MTPERRWNLRAMGISLAFALCGALLALTFAPFNFYLAAPILVLPVFLAAYYSPARRAAWHSFCFGFGLFVSGTYWIYVSVHVFGAAPLWIALFLMFGLVMIMASYLALLGFILARYCGGAAWRLALLGPAVWVIIEWLRGWVLSGFPWMSLGYAQIDSPLAGWAPVLGIYGVSWMLLVSTVALVPIVTNSGSRIAAALLVVMPWLTGVLLQSHAWTSVSGAPLMTTIVQGGVSQDRKWLREQFMPTLNLYRNALLSAEESALVVWPEVAIPAVMNRVPDYLATLQRDVRARGQNLALGILEPSEDGRQVYNSVLLLDGSRQQTYRKRHLVPFGEYFPVPDFVREWMRLMSLPNSDMRAGMDEQPLLVMADGTLLTAAICYEDAYGAEQLYALPDAEVLINVSNDAWFGESIAPHQHLQVARMRALEVERPVVRATNNGISAFIGHDGRLLEVAPQFQFATLSRAIEPRTGLTPYAYTGNTPLILLLSVVAGVGLWQQHRRRSD